MEWRNSYHPQLYGSDIKSSFPDIMERKQAEVELAKAHALRDTLLKQAPVGFAYLDLELRYVLINERLAEINGIPAAKHLGKSIQEIVPSLLPAAQKVADQILATGQAVKDHEFCGETHLAPGVKRYWNESWCPVYDQAGAVVGFGVVVEEVTERKRADEVLIFKENIVRHSSSVIATCDLEGKMTYGNPSFLRTWGFDNPGEFLGRPFWEFWLVEDRRDEIMRILRDRGTWFGEIKAIRKDGSIFDVQVSAATVFDSGGNPVALTSTSTDITERKRTEENLRQHAQILDQISDAVISTDLDGYVVTWNKGAERIFGYLAEEASGKHISLIYPPDQHEFLHYKVIEPLKERGRHESEVKVRRKSGEDFYAYLSLSMLKNVEGLEIGMIGNSIDLTDRRQMEEELRKSREELEIRVRERTAELAKANDGLRHLSSRLLSAQEDKRKRIAGELHDTIGSYLTAVKLKTEEVLQQVNEVSDPAAESLTVLIPMIQEGLEECRRIQQDLRPAILDNLGLLPALSWFCRRYQTIYSNIKVDLEQTLEERCIPDFLKIVIFRVTQEGMNNIAKHSKADRVHLFLREIEGRVELVLEDNGKGFDLKKTLGLHHVRKGLGLTTMRERVELSGGSFVIESTEGKGTVIRASWPIEKPCS